MTIGLLLTSLLLGLRHGIDWDHIAAITDLSGTAASRRHGFVLSFLYAIGHAAVVFALGTAVLLFGASIPEGVDAWMGRFVGVTLVVLGAWVLVSLVRDGRSFRLRSRWMLVLGGTFAGLRRVTRRRGRRELSVVHDHDHEHGHEHERRHDHSHLGAAAVSVPDGVFVGAAVPVGRDTGGSAATRRPHHHAHHHAHHHSLVLPDVATARYGAGTATGIGMLHGVGIESPTQIAVFAASTSLVGARGGLLVLAAWVVGLVVANCGLAALAGFGLLHAERNVWLYRTLAVVIAVGSLAMGVVYLFDLVALPNITP